MNMFFHSELFICWFEEHVSFFFFSFIFFCTLFFLLFHTFLLFVHSKLFSTPYYSHYDCLLFIVLSCQLPFIDVNLCFHSFVFVYYCLFMLSHYFLFMFFYVRLLSFTPSHSLSALVHHSNTFQTCSCLLLLLWFYIGMPTCPRFCLCKFGNGKFKGFKVQGLNFIYKIKFFISFSLFQCFVYVFISLFICVFVSFENEICYCSLNMYVMFILCMLIIQHFCCLLCVGFV